MFEIAKPVGGAYPPGYDPSYWNDRDASELSSAVADSGFGAKCTELRNHAARPVGVDCRLGCFDFLGWSTDPKSHRLPMAVDRGGGDDIGVYSLVLVRPRYVGAFVVVLSIAVVMGIRFGLESMGLHAGDQGAVIGDGITDVWARLGRCKVVSEIYLPPRGNRQFWSESRERRSVAYECLRRSGAKMVVVRSARKSGLDPGWKQFPTRVITFIS
jgi:hypothetical protein